MAKKMTNAEAQAIAILILIGIPIYVIYKIGDTIGWGILIIILLLGIGLWGWSKIESQKKQEEELEQKRQDLIDKYNDTEIVERIMNHQFWQGQTSEQLLESLGNPVDVDQKVLKTKKKEVWKYNHQGGNRYRLRITLDNDYVVGWDSK